jgi:hypothetical protein
MTIEIMFWLIMIVANTCWTRMIFAMVKEKIVYLHKNGFLDAL